MDNPAFELIENDEGCRRSGNREEESIRIKQRRSQYTEEGSHHVEETLENQRVEIPRTIGLFSACAFIVGTVIGSGIFISPKGVLEGSGSVGLALIIWVLCGVFSLLGALTFCELGTLIPESGGDFTYLIHAFAPNRKVQRSWWREVIPFVYQWQNVLFLMPSALTVQGLISGSYLVRLGIFECADGGSEQKEAIRFIAIFIILIISFINCYSITWSVKVQNVMSTAKVIALGLIIIGGIRQLSSGKVGILNTGFDGSVWSYKGISEAFYSGLFAFGGWSNLSFVTNEIKNPQRNLPLAYIISSLFVTFIYTFTLISYFSVLTKEEVLGSDAVAERFGMKMTGFVGAAIMIFSVACSTFGSANGFLFQSGRLIFVSATENHMLDVLSYVHIKKFTPFPAIIFTTLIAILLLMIDIFSLISLGGFAISFLQGVTMATVLYFRVSKKDAVRTFKVPLIIPIIAVLFQLFLFVTPLLDNPTPKYFLVMLMQLVGVLFYTVFVHFRFVFPGLNYTKKFIQKLLMVVPVDE